MFERLYKLEDILKAHQYNVNKKKERQWETSRKVKSYIIKLKKKSGPHILSLRHYALICCTLFGSSLNGQLNIWLEDQRRVIMPCICNFISSYYPCWASFLLNCKVVFRIIGVYGSWPDKPSPVFLPPPFPQHKLKLLLLLTSDGWEKDII
jgi:hypothetical protein